MVLAYLEQPLDYGRLLALLKIKTYGAVNTPSFLNPLKHALFYQTQQMLFHPLWCIPAPHQQPHLHIERHGVAG